MPMGYRFLGPYDCIIPPYFSMGPLAQVAVSAKYAQAVRGMA